MAILTGYRLMWMMVMFDLPVGTKAERRAATEFRKGLLDDGFEMSQFSIYTRLCSGREQAETHVRRVREIVPNGGKVDILFFTDKQFEKMISFTAGRRRAPKKNPDQLAMF
jgi:CRISPR-associated protein Cas2